MSSGLEEGLEADAQVGAGLVAVQQGQLVDQDRAEGEALGGEQAAGRDLAQAAEDALELAVEVLQRAGAQLVEDAPDLGAGVRCEGTAPACS